MSGIVKKYSVRSPAAIYRITSGNPAGEIFLLNGDKVTELIYVSAEPYFDYTYRGTKYEHSDVKNGLGLYFGITNNNLVLKDYGKTIDDDNYKIANKITKANINAHSAIVDGEQWTGRFFINMKIEYKDGSDNDNLVTKWFNFDLVILDYAGSFVDVKASGSIPEVIMDLEHINVDQQIESFYQGLPIAPIGEATGVQLYGNGMSFSHLKGNLRCESNGDIYKFVYDSNIQSKELIPGFRYLLYTNDYHRDNYDAIIADNAILGGGDDKRALAMAVKFVAPENSNIITNKVAWLPTGDNTAKFVLAQTTDNDFLDNNYYTFNNGLKLLNTELSGMNILTTVANGYLLMYANNIPSDLAPGAYSFSVTYDLTTMIGYSYAAKVFTIIVADNVYGVGTPNNNASPYNKDILSNINIDLPTVGGRNIVTLEENGGDNDGCKVLINQNSVEALSITRRDAGTLGLDTQNFNLKIDAGDNHVVLPYVVEVGSYLYGRQYYTNVVNGVTLLPVTVEAGVPFVINISDGFSINTDAELNAVPSDIYADNFTGIIRYYREANTNAGSYKESYLYGIAYNGSKEQHILLRMNGMLYTIRMIVKPLATINVLDASPQNGAMMTTHNTFDGLKSSADNNVGIEVLKRLPYSTNTYDAIDFSKVGISIDKVTRTNPVDSWSGGYTKWADPANTRLTFTRESFNGDIIMVTGTKLVHPHYPEDSNLDTESKRLGKGGAIYSMHKITRDNYPTFATDKHTILIVRTKGDSRDASDMITLTGSHLDNVTLPQNSANYDELHDTVITRGNSENEIIFTVSEKGLDFGTYSTTFKVNNEFDIMFKLVITNDVIPVKYSPEEYAISIKYRTPFEYYVTMHADSPDVATYSVVSGTIPDGVSVALAIDPSTNIKSLKIYGSTTEHNVDEVIKFKINSASDGSDKNVSTHITSTEPVTENKTLTIVDKVPKPFTTKPTDNVTVTPNNLGDYVIDYNAPNGESTPPFIISGDNTNKVIVTSACTPNTVVADRVGRIYANTNDGRTDISFICNTIRTIVLAPIQTDIENADAIIVANGTDDVYVEGLSTQVIPLYVYHKGQGDESKSGEVASFSVTSNNVPDGILLSNNIDSNGLQSLKISGAMTTQPTDSVELTTMVIDLVTADSDTITVNVVIKHNKTMDDPTNGDGYKFNIANNAEALLEVNLTNESSDVDDYQILSGTLPNGLSASIQTSTVTNKKVVVLSGTTSVTTVTDNYNEYNLVVRCVAGGSHLDVKNRIRVYTPILVTEDNINIIIHNTDNRLFKLHKNNSYVQNITFTQDVPTSVYELQGVAYTDHVNIEYDNVPIGEYNGGIVLSNPAETVSIPYTFKSVLKPILVTDKVTLHIPTNKQFSGYEMEHTGGEIASVEDSGSGTFPQGMMLELKPNGSGSNGAFLTGTPTSDFSGTNYAVISSIATIAYETYFKFTIIANKIAIFEHDGNYDYKEEPQVSFVRTITPTDVLVKNITIIEKPESVNVTVLNGSIKVSGIIDDKVYIAKLAVTDNNDYIQNITVTLDATTPVSFLTDTSTIVLKPNTTIDYDINTIGSPTKVIINSGTLPNGLTLATKTVNGVSILNISGTTGDEITKSVETTVSNSISSVEHTFKIMVANTNTYSESVLKPYIYNGINNNIILENSDYIVQTILVKSGNVPNGITIGIIDSKVKIYGSTDISPVDEIIVLSIKSNDITVDHVLLLKIRDLDLNFDRPNQAFSSVKDETSKTVVYTNAGGKINNVMLDKPLPDGMVLAHTDTEVTVTGKADELFDTKQFKISVEGRENPS